MNKQNLSTILLLSLPVFLMDICWYTAWNLLAKPHLFTVGMDDKMFFYGLCIVVFQIVYGIFSMGLGMVGIPASILSWLALVFIL